MRVGDLVGERVGCVGPIVGDRVGAQIQIRTLEEDYFCIFEKPVRLVR